MKPFDIAKPCHQRWNDMRTDGGARHCASCQKHVVDLSALNAAEVRGLVTLTGGTFCGRQQIVDDTLLLAPEPTTRSRSPFGWRVVVGGAVVAGALSAAACQPAHAGAPDPTGQLLAQVDPDQNPNVDKKPDAVVDEPRMMLGEIAYRPVQDDFVTFDARSAKVTRATQNLLGNVARTIKASAWMAVIVIEGHVTVDEKDKDLSLARAEAVKKTLVKLGVDGKRLRTTAGYVGSTGATFRVCATAEACK